MSALAKEVQANTPEEVPLFYYAHIQDAEGAEQQYVTDYLKEPGVNSSEGTIRVFAAHYVKFSPLVRSWFVGRPDGDIQRTSMGYEYIRVEPTHPLYPQIKDACEELYSFNESVLSHIAHKAADTAKAGA
ncbi:hypothetical protein B9J09_06580 [Xylella fastidiosa subsp. pauca]|uniref:hypothetical protein n=1 Tax=Xylella fastidiosa TaxID=2371 RepID=UPI0005838FFA|nr:hypothetical protein [Xylella fastidiosa]ARO68729.1 hypothetical protein B9J09_06580 [Xylella fastidiosa subsp. pauca]AVI20812.1 hypothetical protein BCV75_06110 [Xylella fastidiosa]AVI22847.1 hypothetical protein BC375_06175 [Xylella fastidiosa]KIA58340.1 hypothetical protein RA12_07500 [Xylella fastidiosa]KXB10469.1 hypothetical protein ADT32_09470 [Xylella fastidiosa]